MDSPAVFDPVNTFPEFYGNPVIRRLATERRWTISDREKMPVNMNTLLTYGHVGGGASAYHLDTDTVSLGTLVNRIPSAANHAYYIRAEDIGYVMLDIEKTAPPELTHRLLKLAATDGVYAETSMSGQGYHILLPLPPNFHDHEASMTKAKIQHPDGHYEVLIDHWVTFTRNPIPTHLTQLADTDPANDTVSWAGIYDELLTAAATRPSAGNDVDVHSVASLEPDGYTTAMRDFDDEVAASVVRQVTNTDRKGLADFNHDTSRWEFSTLSLVVRRSARLITERLRIAAGDHPPGYPAYPSDTVLTPEHLVRTAYRCVLELIPYREKHDGTRHDMPYLLYQTVQAVHIVDIPELDQVHDVQKVVNGQWLNSGTH